ncbi:SWIM zinc finger family protein [Paenibacillus sp. J5C_2022]|uniref:SWIM zinc finger family protein n=1 Tax=Paenibacillus sp. J5C2022 TaxID=2977129 RepID=UPI0021D21B78|nr:SWIM zinc finger family protein [Paenibacillus sp. J5C2022]MCU6711893.1 SWIM zinc finger family protein [Paenibacillus sp. J5C2022]
MIEITEAYVDALAPNSSAIKNAQGLSKKKAFVQLKQSADHTLIFGECSGSGKSNYACSADFINPAQPVLRCSCPSRQLPCKHSLGLLYAYIQSGPFETADIPEDVAAKREKVEKREENKAKRAADEVTDKPKKVNKSALKKKVAAQLEGLALLEKFTLGIVRDGLGTIDKKGIKAIQDQVKVMGNHYLSGAQIELRRLAHYLSNKDDQEKAYSDAMEQLTLIHAFIKKGRAHLEAKLEDPELALDHESTIEEWLGHAWQLTELKQFGLATEDAELIQLAFLSYDDKARGEFVDYGYWLEKGSSEVHRTAQYRPYKASKYIKEEDSFFDVAQVKTLYRYPGDMNRRVRWEEMTSRPVTPEDWTPVHTVAQRSFADAVKKVKNQLKNPLGDHQPVMLLHVAGVSQDERGQYVITDESGTHLVLENTLPFGHSTVELLPFLPGERLQRCTMLVMFQHQMDTGRLVAQPLSVMKDAEITRLMY